MNFFFFGMNFQICYDKDSPYRSHFEHIDQSDMTINMCLSNSGDEEGKRGGQLLISSHNTIARFNRNKVPYQSKRLLELHPQLLSTLEKGDLNQRNEALKILQNYELVPLYLGELQHSHRTESEYQRIFNFFF